MYSIFEFMCSHRISSVSKWSKQSCWSFIKMTVVLNHNIQILTGFVLSFAYISAFHRVRQTSYGGDFPQTIPGTVHHFLLLDGFTTLC